jgi:murein L,D-transpeptidase YcbB/YkuD
MHDAGSPAAPFEVFMARPRHSVAALVLALAALTVSCGGKEEEIREALSARVAADEAPAYVPRARWKLVQAIYAGDGHAPRWLEGEKPNDRALALAEAICRAEGEALRLRDYDVAGLRGALERAYLDGETTAEEIAEVELRLTGLFVEYASDLAAGRLDPRRVDTAWFITTRRSQVDTMIAEAMRGEDWAAMRRVFLPERENYTALAAALQRYAAVRDSGGWDPIPAGRPLRLGEAKDPRVPLLRARLAASGDLAPDAAAGTVFDRAVADAISRFEARHGLEADGVLDARTLAELNVPVERRIRQLEINLERLRWLPNGFGERYILVNIPEYTLFAYEGGKEEFTMPVIVGKEYDGATPVFSDSLSYVVFRPYWNVPEGIALEEIVPKARENPAFLEANRYEIVESTKEDATPVPPESIDWSDVDSTNFPYRIRQRPGPGNALGLVKFMFPNQFAIYLHDTPADHLFERRDRALSHGCIRVQDPARLASYVFEGDPEWDEERIEAEMTIDEAGAHAIRPETVEVPRKTPVYIVYLTAFVRDGEVQFREDLYGVDQRAAAKLGEPTPAAERARLCAELDRLLRGEKPEEGDTR